MSPPTSSFGFRTSPATSPRITVELFQSASSSPSVVETTYLGMEFILSANPASSVIDGQALAKPSYVTRPSSCASAAISSSSLNLSPSSPRLNSKDHPACSNSSPPPGASMTPSRETNSVTTTLPISSSFALSVRSSEQRGTIVNYMVDQPIG